MIDDQMDESFKQQKKFYEMELGKFQRIFQKSSISRENSLNIDH